MELRQDNNSLLLQGIFVFLKAHKVYSKYMV